MKRIAFFTLLSCVSAVTVFAQTADTLNLLPRPLSTKISTGRFNFTSDFNIGLKGPESPKFIAAINRFYQQLGRRVSINFLQEFISAADNDANARLFITYDQAIVPAIGMDESYSLK